MTDSSYTHILAVVDRSGSMEYVVEDMIGGLNGLFAEQAKLPGKCLVDYVQFDTVHETVFEDVDVSEAKAVLEPRGMTALLDAIGKSVTNLGTKLRNLPEDKRPGQVIVAVITDGAENASRKWTASKVKELITQQENKYNWNFTFLGANMDAVAVGQSFGFNANQSLTFDTNNTSMTTSILSGYVSNVRSAGVASYSDSDREAAK